MSERETRTSVPQTAPYHDPGATADEAAPHATIDDGRVARTTPLPPASARYQLGEEIARGGMGVIYRATDTVLGREVAVKVLQDRFGQSFAVARRFHDEARIAAQLQHPAIPPVHDLGTLPDGRPYSPKSNTREVAPPPRRK